MSDKYYAPSIIVTYYKRMLTNSLLFPFQSQDCPSAILRALNLKHISDED